MVVQNEEDERGPDEKEGPTDPDGAVYHRYTPPARRHPNTAPQARARSTLT